MNKTAVASDRRPSGWFGQASRFTAIETALYLRGTVLDYSSQLIAGGFKFTNPNAKASCSCGESFSV